MKSTIVPVDFSEFSVFDARLTLKVCLAFKFVFGEVTDLVCRAQRCDYVENDCFFLFSQFVCLFVYLFCFVFSEKIGLEELRNSPYLNPIKNIVGVTKECVENFNLALPKESHHTPLHLM